MISVIGDIVIVDDDDERLILTGAGTFRAEVIPEDADEAWRTLDGADQLVEFYDPTDVFGDLADALAEAFPSVAPGAEQSDADGGDGDVETTDDGAAAEGSTAETDTEDKPSA